MAKRWLILISVFSLLLIPAVGQTDTFVFQQGIFPDASYAGTEDTHIISWDDGDMLRGNSDGQNQLFRHLDGTNAGQNLPPNNYLENPQNMGGFDLMEEGDNGGGSNDSKVLLIQFLGLEQYPTSYFLTQGFSAKIGLYFDQYRPGNDNPSHTLYVNRILKKWSEGIGATNPGDRDYDGTDTIDNSGAVTWNSTGFELWQAMGAEGPEDIAPTEHEFYFDTAVVKSGTWVWFDVTQSAKIWFGNPALNHGVKISQEVYPTLFKEPDLTLPNGQKVYSSSPVDTPATFVNGRYVFRTSEHAEVLTRPQLVIEYGISPIGNWSIY